MKRLRRISSRPESLHFSSLRVDSNSSHSRAPTPEIAPQIEDLDFSPFGMDGSAHSRRTISRSSPNLLNHNGVVTTVLTQQEAKINGPQSPVSAFYSTETPSRIPTRRKVSQSPFTKHVNGADIESHNMPPSPTTTTAQNDLDASVIDETQQTPTLSPSTSSPSTHFARLSIPGNGSAGGGKSSKVIDRLMGEIDRLKRSLKAETLHREELARDATHSQRSIATLTAENSNLTQAKEVDEAMLKRRDRRIDALKTELESERAKRIEAEKKLKAEEGLRKAELARLRRELAEAREVGQVAARYIAVNAQMRLEIERVEATNVRLQKAQAEMKDEVSRVVSEAKVLIAQGKACS